MRVWESEREGFRSARMSILGPQPLWCGVCFHATRHLFWAPQRASAEGVPAAASDVWPLGRCGRDIGVGQSGVGRLSIGGTDFGACTTVAIVRAQIHL